ncbi:MAG: thiamine diphosphokinase [Hyphomicrobiales bacterium]
MTDDSTHFAVLLAGPVTPTARLRRQVEGARTIAADGGIAHARALGLTPELWVGDFDSSSDNDGDAYPGITRKAFPAAKSTTDGALAIHEAINRGANAITIVGAFGGRTDHTFAIMADACARANEGLTVLLSNGDEEATPLSPEPQSFDYPSGTVFSVLAFSGLEGLTLEGAVWPLDAITMPFGDTLTISNEVDGQLTATLNQGTALLIARLKNPDG